MKTPYVVVQRSYELDGAIKPAYKDPIRNNEPRAI